MVFVHGYLVDGRLWDGVVDRLSDRFRCLAPDWPIGSQQIAMNPDADLTPYGIAATIASFLEALDLEDVTIVGNDSGGAMSQVLVTRHPERIGRLVLTNCDTHENFPPGPFKAMVPLAKLPGGMTVLGAPFRIGAVARARLQAFREEADPAGADRLLDGARPQRPRRQARPQKGHRRDEQALHAGGGREAARLRAADPAHLGARRQVLPDLNTPNGSPRKPATPASSRSPTPAPSSRSTSPQRLAEEIAGFVGPKPVRTGQRSQKFFRKCAGFSSDCGESSVNPLQRRRAMAKQIFDQDRPRSTMAQQLDEAFAGCDQWTLAPPPQRAAASTSARALELLEDDRQRRRGANPGAARAVVVGVVQEQDVAGPGAGGRPTGYRAGRRPRVQSLPQRDQRTGRQPRLRIARRPAALKIP